LIIFIYESESHSNAVQRLRSIISASEALGLHSRPGVTTHHLLETPSCSRVFIFDWKQDRLWDCFERQACTGDSNETLLMLETMGSGSRSSVVLPGFLNYLASSRIPQHNKYVDQFGNVASTESISIVSWWQPNTFLEHQSSLGRDIA